MTHSIRTKYKLSEIAFKSGFKFRDIENRKLDWKSLGSVDVNKVIDSQDYEFLERILPQIIEAPMQTILNAAVLDPAVASLFRLAQLSLQYLSFCQQFMDHTLYDLRSAFNHLQRKNLNLKNSYKRLEEEYNKAQKRIQSLSNENNEEPAEPAEPAEKSMKVNSIKSQTLFSCDQCTKNFLSVDSLKSHQQRKHSVIEEKHESSDDNEKGKANSSTLPTQIPVQSLLDASSQSVELVNVLKETPEAIAEDGAKQNIQTAVSSDRNVTNVAPNVRDSDNAANPIGPDATQLIKGNRSNNERNLEDTVKSNIADTTEYDNTVPSNECAVCLQRALLSSSNIEVQCDESAVQTNNNAMSGIESDLIQTAYETINELKHDILELRRALSGQATTATNADSQGIKMTDDGKLYETNEKIDVIEQKFNAFESKFMQSQNHFIESFRSLDEQQKSYMTNIQETIREIVEKSLTEQHTSVDDTSANKGPESQKHSREPVEMKPAQSKPEVKPRTTLQINPVSTTSESDSDNGEVVCRVDIHAVDSDQLNGKGKESKSIEDGVRRTDPRKGVINELEQRLRQIGVDADSTGLSTPRSEQAQQNLSGDREEMVKSYKSFSRARTKLKDEVERIAKGRLTSASSMTSLSSKSQHSTDSSENDGTQQQGSQIQRPKTASLQNTRKRHAKKVMQKLVENDIDESDILNKMQKAKQVINEHRECIQELLQTTAHGPNTMNQVPRIKYSTSAAEKANGTLVHDDSDNAPLNKYNKMPNVTTRRVVFVNLDEDS